MNTGPKLEFKEIASTFEAVTKVSITITAIVYVLGLFVVNIFLNRYGFRNFGLLQLHYIAAGLWLLVPIVLILLLVLCFVLVNDFNEIERDSEIKPRQWLEKQNALSKMVIGWALDRTKDNVFKNKTLETIFLALIFWGLLVYGLSYFLGIKFSWNWLIAMLIIGFIVGGIAMGAFGLLQLSDAKIRIFSRVMLIFYTVAIPFYILFFALQIYPEIPASLGGGAGQPVQFVVDVEKQSILEAAGIEVSDENISTRVLLLLETDKEYLIISKPDSKAISLQKDLISAVLYR